jgi:hypothetical protein
MTILVPFLFHAGIFAAQGTQSESGISEADTVRIPNSARNKSDETILIKNSDASEPPDTDFSPISKESTPEHIWVGNSKHTAETPLALSSNGRVQQKGKIIAGASLFGVSYGLAVVVASSLVSNNGSASENGLATSFFVPVVGPIVAEIVSPPSSGWVPLVTLLCLGWSAVQGIGLTLFITGLVGTPAMNDYSALPFSVEPLVMEDRVGLTIRMRFNHFNWMD